LERNKLENKKEQETKMARIRKRKRGQKNRGTSERKETRGWIRKMKFLLYEAKKEEKRRGKKVRTAVEKRQRAKSKKNAQNYASCYTHHEKEREQREKALRKKGEAGGPQIGKQKNFGFSLSQTGKQL